MNRSDENNQSELTPDETAMSVLCPEEPVAPKGKPHVSRNKKFRNFIFSLLVIVYIFTTLVSGYWYMSRPIRKDQIDKAYVWWTAIAGVYHIPVPKDERWGG